MKKNKNVVCAYCGHETNALDKIAIINHITTCEKRPEKNLLKKAFEIEDKLFTFLNHVTTSEYKPSQCETCAEIKQWLDRYNEK